MEVKIKKEITENSAEQFKLGLNCFNEGNDNFVTNFKSENTAVKSIDEVKKDPDLKLEPQTDKMTYSDIVVTCPNLKVETLSVQSLNSDTLERSVI
ncbi:hypothetical protein ILUMI_02406, partial [Ignelater luminosus]